MKKYLIPVLMAVALAGGSTALAADSASATSTGSSMVKPSQPAMILEVNKNGGVTLRGTIEAISAGSLVVKGWGGDWTIDVPSASVSQISSFKTGDFVGVNGTVSQSQPWTIEAKLVRDWTGQKSANQAGQQTKKQINQLEKSARPRTYEGTASNLSGDSFSFSVKGNTYAVSVATNAKVVDKKWATINLSDVQSGDTVRVWGTLSGTNLTAEVVRDVSLPAVKTGQ